jgi:hypothetical protein
MFWKVMVGAGVGVGAVALAPFTGGGSIAGAIALGEALTVGGAIVGVVGGGVAGAVVEVNNKNKMKDAKEEGKQEAKAEFAIKISKVMKELKLVSERIDNADAYFETLIAMENVAVAVIAYNGINVRSKQNEISDLLRSLSNTTLPKNIQNKINHIYLKPPSIREAFSFAKNAKLDRDVCRDIIMLSAESCNINSDDFLREWQKSVYRS